MATYTNPDNLMPQAQSAYFRNMVDPTMAASLASSEDPRSGMDRLLQSREQNDIAMELLRQSQTRGKNSNDYQSLLNQQLTAQSQAWDSGGQLANLNNQNAIALAPEQHKFNMSDMALKNSPVYRELLNAAMMAKPGAERAGYERALADDSVEMDKPRTITVGDKVLDLGVMSNKEWREVQLAVAQSELSAEVKQAVAQEATQRSANKLPTAWIQIRQKLEQQYPGLPPEALDKMTNESVTNAYGRQDAVTQNVGPQAGNKIRAVIQAAEDIGKKGPTTTTTTQQKFPNAPPVGTVKNGYTYKGGDPASPTSWSK